MLNRSKCIILVPVYTHVEQACEESLQKLERAGYTVWRQNAGAAIDVARCKLAMRALRAGYEEIMWIDSDIAFDEEAVETLRDHELPLVGGLYPKKAQRAFSFHVDASTLRVGTIGSLVEVTYGATGFLHTRREIYEKMKTRLQLPLCNEDFDESFYPFFLPQIIPHKKGHWYLAEDYSFCQRARDCGYKILLDSTIRLWHIGSYAYSWEDACGDRQRFDSFHFDLDRPNSAKQVEDQAPDGAESETK